MKDPSLKQILSIVQNIEKDIQRENRNDRLKSLGRENELLRGDNERLWERVRSLEEHFGIQFVRENKYKKR